MASISPSFFRTRSLHLFAVFRASHVKQLRFTLFISFHTPMKPGTTWSDLKPATALLFATANSLEWSKPWANGEQVAVELQNRTRYLDFNILQLSPDIKLNQWFVSEHAKNLKTQNFLNSYQQESSPGKMRLMAAALQLASVSQQTLGFGTHISPICTRVR